MIVDTILNNLVNSYVPMVYLEMVTVFSDFRFSFSEERLILNLLCNNKKLWLAIAQMNKNV